ncbi:MAG: hypothetical protein SVR08_15500 [Spirochaetota bacterium]|nr:hypothetical protein [Spirochaetota bacterium]
MAKIEPFESFSEEYDEWFVKHREVYEVELNAIKNFIPFKGKVWRSVLAQASSQGL